MEAGRAVANGFVTPDRTLMIASTSRFYVVNEKIAMGDGRYDQERLLKAIGEHAQASLLFDMEALAKESGAMHQRRDAGRHRRLRPACRSRSKPSRRRSAPTARRSKAICAASAPGSRRRASGSAAPPRADGKRRGRAAPLDAFERGGRRACRRRRATMIDEGVRRLAAYQDVAYARLYLDRLARHARGRRARRRRRPAAARDRAPPRACACPTRT